MMIKIRRLARWKLTLGVLVGVVGYILSYALLMRRTYDAIDDNFEIAFKSAFIFAEVQSNMRNGLTVTYVRTSWANYFFAPIDYGFHKLNPALYHRAGRKNVFPEKKWFMME